MWCDLFIKAGVGGWLLWYKLHNIDIFLQLQRAICARLGHPPLLQLVRLPDSGCFYRFDPGLADRVQQFISLLLSKLGGEGGRGLRSYLFILYDHF